MLDLKEYGIVMWPEGKIVSFVRNFSTGMMKIKEIYHGVGVRILIICWVSEIMLQQTRVDTVIPYYERFLTGFQAVESLATAPEERLLKAWEGLGYYSRSS